MEFLHLTKEALLVIVGLSLFDQCEGVRADEREIT